MTALPTHVVPLTGLRTDDKFTAAAAGGDDCQTGPGVLLLVKNDDVAEHTVTLVTPGTVDGDLAVADRPVPVPAGGMEAIPITARYRDPSTGRAAITYDATTSVTVAVIRAAVL